jgi:S1-C subfamily serine protease
MRLRSTIVIVLLAALLTGCASQPPATNSSSLASSGSIVLYAAPVIGLTLNQDLRVLDVQPGSAAEQAGIQRGDVLAKIGTTPLEAGIPSATLLGLVQDLIAAQAHQAVQLTVVRDGQEIAVAVQPTAPNGTPNQPTPTAVPANQVYF